MPSINHLIQQGEGISALCKRYGFSPDRIWDDPANAELRRQRADPDILLPGDVVVIPDLVPKHVAKPTGARHTFRRLGVPAYFRLQFWNDRWPRANEPYTLFINGVEFAGTTDAEGALAMFVPNESRSGVLLLGAPGTSQERFEISIGTMDPSAEDSGLQKRLANLGYYTGELHGTFDDETARALQRFQADAGITVTGARDAATLERLERLHDTTVVLAVPPPLPPAPGNP